MNSLGKYDFLRSDDRVWRVFTKWGFTVVPSKQIVPIIEKWCTFVCSMNQGLTGLCEKYIQALYVAFSKSLINPLSSILKMKGAEVRSKVSFNRLMYSTYWSLVRQERFFSNDEQVVTEISKAFLYLNHQFLSKTIVSLVLRWIILGICSLNWRGVGHSPLSCLYCIHVFKFVSSPLFIRYLLLLLFCYSVICASIRLKLESMCFFNVVLGVKKMSIIAFRDNDGMMLWTNKIWSISISHLSKSYVSTSTQLIILVSSWSLNISNRKTLDRNFVLLSRTISSGYFSFPALDVINNMNCFS